MRSTLKTFFFTYIFGLVCSFTAMAGGYMQFTTAASTNIGALHTTLETSIFEQVAVNLTRQTFVNPSATDSSRITYGIALTSSASVTSFRWCIAGSWFVGTLQSSKDTTGGAPPNGTDHFAKQFGTYSFIFPFKVKIAPSDTIVVEVTSVELLPFGSGTISYEYHTASVGGEMPILDEWKFSINSQHKVVSFSSEHFPGVQPPTTGALVCWSTNVRSTSSVLRAHYALEYDGLTMNVLSTKPVGEDGYAIMMAVPKSNVDQSMVLPKRFTFVLDRSGSMSGGKISQAHEAAKYCIERLNARDIFNVIKFDNVIESFAPTHLLADPNNIQGAISFINGASARGGTNIMGAMSSALAMMQNDNYINNIVFLTDGLAEVHLATLRNLNISMTRVFVFGIGSNVNSYMLTQLAEQNNGVAEFISDGASVVAPVQRLWEKIRDPLIKNPRVSFSPDVVYDVFPQVIPDIYAGEQLVMVGRYRTPGKNVVTITGGNGSGEVRHAFDAFLTDQPDVNTFVAKIWAQQRIEELLLLMKSVTANSGLWKEYRDEIITLGLRYGIVTPYTSFVDSGQKEEETDPDPPGDVSGVAGDELSIALDRTTISPNPVALFCEISIDLSGYEGEDAIVEIVDAMGRAVALLFKGVCLSGQLNLTWDSTDSAGMQVSSGRYMLVITLGTDRSATSVTVQR